MRQHTAEVTRRRARGPYAYGCTITVNGRSRYQVGATAKEAYTNAYKYIRKLAAWDMPPPATNGSTCPDCGGAVVERMVSAGMNEYGTPQHETALVCRDCGEEFDLFMMQFV